jgi:hypothetical protein
MPIPVIDDKTLTEITPALGVERATYALSEHHCVGHCDLDVRRFIYHLRRIDQIENNSQDTLSERLWNYNVDHLQGFRRELAKCYDYHHPPTKSVKVPKGLGAREFTFTYSPKWFKSDLDARVAMEQSITKLLRYYEGEIVRFRAIGEGGYQGKQSHVHCFYELLGGRKMTDKNFKRAWVHWNPKKPLGRGFEGGHHASVASESNFLGYIEKEVDTAWLDISRGE